MVRKSLLLAAVGMGLVLFFFGRDAASYFGTTAGWIKHSVKDSIPLEFEIDRARKMVKNLVPDIRSNMHVIAQEEVEVERLEKQIAESEGTMGKDRADLLRLKNDLAGNQPSYQYGGRVYTVAQVKQDLANRFERAKTHEATLSSLREILSARQRSLAAARQKLEGMLATKRQLEVDLENLDARMKMVEVAQTTSAYNFDDSQLGRAKELIGEVRTRLSVAERLVNAQTDIQGEIPLTESAADNIVDQVTEYLSGDNGKVAEGR